MKRRALSAFVALMCVITLLVAPVHAYAPPSNDGGISTCAEVVRWYYRTNNGVREMRLWSVTRGIWLTDWVPVPNP